MVGSGAVTHHGAPEQQQHSGRNSRSVDFDRDVKLAGRPRRRWDGVVPMYKTRHHKDTRRRRPEGHRSRVRGGSGDGECAGGKAVLASRKRRGAGDLA